MTYDRVAADPTSSLRRLRVRLTLLYVLVSAMALAPLTIVALRSDAAQWEVRLDAAIEVQARTAAALVYFDDDQLILSEIAEDEVGSGDPPVVVLLGVPPVQEVFASTDPASLVDISELTFAGARAVVNDAVAWEDARNTAGQRVRLGAAPYYDNDGAPAGAVVAIADPGPGSAAHTRLVVALLLTYGGLLLVAGIGGHVLAARRVKRLAEELRGSGSQLSDRTLAAARD